MARVQAETELLAIEGVAVGSLLDGLTAAFTHLDELEGHVGLLDRSLAVSDPGNLTVCIVDDDVRLAELTATRLARRGIDATYTTDLKIDHGVDTRTVLVIDLGVLLNASARDRAALANRSFLVVSGDASMEAKTTAMATGAAEFLVKPVPIGQLIWTISRMLESST